MKASREGRSPIRLLRGKSWLQCTWKPQRPFPDHPSSVITLVMQVLTYSFRCKPLWIGMKCRVNEDMGRGETNINQAYAILIVIFIESLLSDRHGVQRFTCTSSFNSHNSPLRCTLLSQFYRWGNWCTEKLKVKYLGQGHTVCDRAGFSTLSYTLYQALHRLVPTSGTSL